METLSRVAKSPNLLGRKLTLAAEYNLERVILSGEVTVHF